MLDGEEEEHCEEQKGSFSGAFKTLRKNSISEFVLTQLSIEHGRKLKIILACKI